MQAPSPPLRVALFGAGRVGTAVALTLARTGHRVVAVGPVGRASSEAAAQRLQAPVSNRFDCDLLLVGVPDAALPGVVQDLAAAAPRAFAAVHFAGALGISPLEPLAARGVHPLALHPVAACPDVDSALRRLPGSAWGVTGEPGVAAWAARLVERDLGGHPVEVPEALRPLWHAAAVVAANGVGSLLALGEDILKSAGFGSPHRILAPLAAGVAANALEGGGAGRTLTGPVVRADAAAVAAQLRAVEALGPALADAYRTAQGLVVAAAERAGRLSGAAAVELRAALGMEGK